MRKFTVFFTIIFVLSCRVSVWAGDQYGGFKEDIDSGALRPFARDLGSILGAATFHNGRSLGFSGFDVGVRSGIRFSPSGGNRVLRNRDVSLFGLPWLQAEIGLPFRIDGYIRGISVEGLTITGGGLRYSIRKLDKGFVPQFLVAGSAHSVAHRHFSASHIGLNLITSVTINELAPYFGVGMDRTRVVILAVPVRDAALEGKSTVVVEPRFTVGASYRPKPYLYLHAGYTLTHLHSGMDSGVGIRF